MLKTLGSTEPKTRPSEGGVKVGRSSKFGRDGSGSELDESGIDNVEVDGGKVGDDETGKKGRQKSKNLSKSKKMVGSDFLTPEARLAFTKLRQAFVKAPILHHFDPEHHI